MATFNLRYFSHPALLRAIAPSRLLAFLSPYRIFLTARGFQWPDDGAEISYDKLVEIFTTPDADTPEDLVDALFLVDEMSAPEQSDALVDAELERGIVFADDEQSMVDIAVQMWLSAPELLERKHAEKFAFKPKSFEYFQAARGRDLDYQPLNNETRLLLQNELDDWFEKKQRGRGSRVMIWENEYDVRFLIRHGEPFKRDEKLAGEEVSGISYRPLKYDVVIYDRKLSELQINATLVGQKKTYCQLLGKYLFGDERCFPAIAKYTLDPLRDEGPESIVCSDVDGIDSVTLTEVHVLWGGAFRELEIHKATDVFSALSSRGLRLPENARIIKAVLKVKFANCKTPRTVKIRPSNIAEFTRDGDSVMLKQWLELRGFCIPREVREHATSSVLAGA